MELVSAPRHLGWSLTLSHTCSLTHRVLPTRGLTAVLHTRQSTPPRCPKAYESVHVRGWRWPEEISFQSSLGVQDLEAQLADTMLPIGMEGKSILARPSGPEA